MSPGKMTFAVLELWPVLFCDGKRWYGVPAPFPAEDIFFSFF